MIANTDSGSAQNIKLSTIIQLLSLISDIQ